MKAILNISQCKDVRAFITESNTRRIGMLYFQRTGECDLIARMVTADTDGTWLKQMIAAGKIYVCDERIICEVG